MRVAADGKTLATASHDRTVKVWNLDTMQATFTLEGYKSTVWAVAFSPNGQTLASGSHNDSLKVWKAVAAWADAFPPPPPAPAAENKPVEQAEPVAK
jgi:hypothetical protein